jgi:hypothetical protein
MSCKAREEMPPTSGSRHRISYLIVEDDQLTPSCIYTMSLYSAYAKWCMSLSMSRLVEPWVYVDGWCVAKPGAHG